MDRPRVLSIIAWFYLLLGAVFFLAAVPTQSLQDTYILFGAVVSSRTFTVWMLMQGGIWTFCAYSFFHGLELGFYILIGASASLWGISLMSGGPNAGLVADLVLHGPGVIFSVVHRDWFRN